MTNDRKIVLHDAFVQHILEAVNQKEDRILIFHNMGLTDDEISEILED